MSAQVFQQASLRDDVANVRNIVQRDRFGRENCRGHARQGGILGAANRYATFDWIAAANAKLFHEGRLAEKRPSRKAALCVPLCLRGVFRARLI